MRAHDDEAATASRPQSVPGSPPPRRAARRAAIGSGLARARLTRAAALALACAAFACSELTAPPEHRRTVTEPAPPPAAAPVAPSTLAVADKTPALAQPGDQIEASHILVSYQGATRAKPTVTRTRDEARELATQLSERVRQPGADFARLAQEVSDGPSGVEGGVLPRFGRQQMVKPFSDAAFALRPGEVSGVVETNFGFHIIKRLQ